MSKRADKAALEKLRVKNLERALQTERLGLHVLAVAFVREHGNSERLQERVDAIVRTAAANPKTSEGLLDTLVKGQGIIENAIRIETAKPQRLFSPDVGHVDAAKVQELVEPGVDQLALTGAGEAHHERSHWADRVEAGIVSALEKAGPCTDWELYAAYQNLRAYPRTSLYKLRLRRADLRRRGRIVDTGERRDDVPVWTLIERQAA